MDSKPDLNAALRVPGMLGEAIEYEFPATVRRAILEALEESLDGLDQFRGREGREIADAMLRHNEGIAAVAFDMPAVDALTGL